jgi:hypothetical protein
VQQIISTGGIPMRAPDDNTTASRSGTVVRRLISPWEYRHPRASAAARFTGSGFHLGVGLVLVSLGRRAGTDQERRKCYRWATYFLVVAPLHFIGGCMDMAVDRPASPRT